MESRALLAQHGAASFTKSLRYLSSYCEYHQVAEQSYAVWVRHYFSLWLDMTAERFIYRPFELVVKYGSTNRQSTRRRCGARIFPGSKL